jgi:hypothetical protein
MRVIGVAPVAALLLSGLHHGVVAKVIFSTSPANPVNLMQEAFPVGNGRLGGMCIHQLAL